MFNKLGRLDQTTVVGCGDIYSSSPRKVENQQALESQSTDYTLYTPVVGGKGGKLPYAYSV